jgi:hypothetical protein
MTRFALALSLALAAPAFADGGFEVRLPILPEMDAAEASALYDKITRALIFGQNCAGYAITQGEWELLVRTSDMIGENLDIGVAESEARMQNVFAELDADPSACGREIPAAQETIRHLILLGGGTEPV